MQHYNRDFQNKQLTGAHLMNTNENTKVHPGLVMGELFHTAPRAMSALFGTLAAAVVIAGAALI
jgi:hypothetical protein